MTTAVKFCPWCGQQNDINATVCASCGKNLEVSAPSQPPRPAPAPKKELTMMAKYVSKVVIYLTITTAIICAGISIFGIWFEDNDTVWRSICSLVIEILASCVIITVSKLMRENPDLNPIITVKNVCVWVNIFATLFFSFIAIISLWVDLNTDTTWKSFGSIGVVFLATLTTATVINYLPQQQNK